MLHQSGAFSNFNIHQMLPNQFQSNVPLINNSPYLGFPHGTNFSNANQFVSVPIHHNHHHHQQQQQQHQNCQTLNQNTKLNSREIQNVSISNQEFPTEQFSHQSNSAGMNFSFPDMLNYDLRYGNYNRLNLPMSNTNHNLNQNVCSASNTAVHNGLNCLGPEDSGALNNQVPPGNRANNYWDNFRR